MRRMRVDVFRRPRGLALACTVAAGLSAPLPAMAISIELDGIAADRIDRQRKAAEGVLPLAGTPDLTNFEGRLAEAGLASGAPVFIRIFKAESELELWMQKDGAYVRFATYPICYWSGTLGPKTREGDRQAPEGFYTITRRLLHRGGRWPRSLNLGFPNIFDKAQDRDGSYILVHGGCSSVGCFAMTNGVIKEVYDLTEAALDQGQSHVPVHVFPFRMTEANLAEYPTHPWRDFWLNLKQGYDAFERTKVPPQVGVCQSRYEVEQVASGEALPGPLGVCGSLIEAADVLDRWYMAAALRPSSWRSGGLARLEGRRAELAATRARRSAELVREWSGAADEPSAAAIVRASTGPHAAKKASGSCSLKRASCRKFASLKRGTAAKAATKRVRTASRGRRA